MTSQKFTLAANILKLAGNLVPDRVPTPNPEIVKAWAAALDKNYPAELWADAVYLWAAELVGDRMITPREILKAAKIVLQRWEIDPVRGPQLRAYRERLRDERDRQIAEGTFAEVRGYGPRTAVGTGGSTDGDLQAVVERVKSRLKL